MKHSATYSAEIESMIRKSSPSYILRIVVKKSDAMRLSVP